MPAPVEDLNSLLADTGGVAETYKKLLRLAIYRIQTDQTLYAGNRNIWIADAKDAVNEAFWRLIDEGAGGKKPYYALRAFVDNGLHSMAKAKRSEKESVLAGGVPRDPKDDSKEVELADQSSPTPAQVINESWPATRIRRALDWLEERFSEGLDALLMLEQYRQWNCDRAEVIEATGLSESVHDAKRKQIQRAALKHELEEQP